MKTKKTKQPVLNKTLLKQADAKFENELGRAFIKLLEAHHIYRDQPAASIPFDIDMRDFGLMITYLTNIARFMADNTTTELYYPVNGETYEPIIK